jgi:hypothetical protein
MVCAVGATNSSNFFEDKDMNTKYVENGLALMGAILILVAVGFAANTALTGIPDLELATTGHTSTLVAVS